MTLISCYLLSDFVFVGEAFIDASRILYGVRIYLINAPAVTARTYGCHEGGLLRIGVAASSHPAPPAAETLAYVN